MTDTSTTPPAGGLLPPLSPLTLNAICAAWMLAAYNSTFWGHLTRILAGKPIAAAVFAVVIWALILLVAVLLAVRRVQKPVLGLLLVLSAVTSFYMDRLGVVIDRDMIQNAMTTTFAESRHLITADFVLHVLLWGVLPALVLAVVPVRRAGVLRSLGVWVLAVAGVAALVAGLLFSNFKTYSAVLREHKEMLASVQPLAPVAGAVRYARLMMKSAAVVVVPTGTDAAPGPFLSAADRPVLMVIVAGETSRAANWSLGGYARPTNPELARRDVIYYSAVTSCGTATAVSLPCMFSPLTRDSYSHEGGLSHENLLDVLVHAGFHVEWWDNNTGDKGIAARIPSRKMTAADGAEFCNPECIDGVFLKHLQQVADTMTQNTVIVLHQIGSHGPSYWLRYPEGSEVFGPACRTSEFADCTPDQIVNAYDNTIAYTDLFLSQVIDMLQATDRVIPAMFYVSDHGESLGENGMYLHGAPYFMAPEVQTHVPQVVWLSDRFGATMGLDRDCLAAGRAAPVSHDNMFSTVLGMLDVRTAAVDSALDLTGACRDTTPS